MVAGEGAGSTELILDAGVALLVAGVSGVGSDAVAFEVHSLTAFLMASLTRNRMSRLSASLRVGNSSCDAVALDSSEGMAYSWLGASFAPREFRASCEVVYGLFEDRAQGWEILAIDAER